MAGLTKEQRAERAAAKLATAQVDANAPEQQEKQEKQEKQESRKSRKSRNSRNSSWWRWLPISQYSRERPIPPTFTLMKWRTGRRTAGKKWSDA